MIKRSNNGGLNKLSMVLVIASILVSMVAISISLLNKHEEIVYVDAQKLMKGYKGMVDARMEFESKVAAWQSNLDTLRLELESKINEYESTSAKLTPREKSLMEELIKSKQDQFVNYQQVITEKVQKEDYELTQRVLSKVNDYVKRYGEDKGYAIIMAATQYGNIVYAEDYTDITTDVLAGLNTEYTN